MSMSLNPLGVTLHSICSRCAKEHAVRMLQRWFVFSGTVTAHWLSITKHAFIFYRKNLSPLCAEDDLIHFRPRPAAPRESATVRSHHFRITVNLKKMNRFMTNPTKWSVRPAQIQISLGIPPVWSVFAVHSMGSWGPNVSSCGQRRLWSDWADSQADLRLRWAHRSFCWFCLAAAQIII